jgi:Na+/melibiose symporter-like transporter
MFVAEKLKATLLYTYGIADLFFALMVNMEVYFFSAFLTDYAQFPLETVGWILGITSVFDIACALIAGVVLQRVTLKLGGKYRSWFLIGPPAIAVLFTLQFTRLGSDGFAVAIIIFGFLSSHLIWNIVVTASGAMVGRLSQRPQERTILSANRAQGLSVAGLLFAATAVPMMLFFSERTNQVAGVSLTVGVYNIFMILGYWYIYRMTAGRDPYDETLSFSGSERRKGGQSIWRIIKLAIRNPPLLGLVSAEIFRNSYVLIITAYAYYYFTYVLNEFAFMSLFIFAIGVARFSGTLVASWVGNKVGKRNAYWASMVLAASGFGISAFWADSVWGFTSTFCLASMMGMIAGSMSTALFSDTVVYGEWKTGENIRAFTMALQSFPIKIAVFIRSGVVTFGLMAIGYVHNTDPAPAVAGGIRFIMIFAPTAACLLSASLLFWSYGIEDAHIPRMQDEIAAGKVPVE